jgi:Iap family predicted aminopeptidase
MADEAPADDWLAGFRDIVDGIANDVFACAQARDLDLTIGKFKKEIEEAGYGRLFWAVQAMASRDMVLSIRKIFDDDNRWPQRTIPKALHWVDKNKQVILGLDNIHRWMGGCRGLCEALKEIRDSLPAKKDKRHSEECECPSCSFDRVKTMVDKEVAHNEVHVIADRPKY